MPNPVTPLSFNRVYEDFGVLGNREEQTTKFVGCQKNRRVKWVRGVFDNFMKTVLNPKRSKSFAFRMTTR